ncbi:LRR receptor-like serine/threonine-protein kinase GSO1 [Vigna radiata var. radiata]|uniref:LRR receptor-like serine/threonine-protein kinase GSO1 n=1 Tax=Vigna radiata var. radiata TaxID=3916 RepID=A0A1S3U6H8_VIGRR|nr:LRR receptor-like serine/threonine-protein kinase GSO1 [Vigna radiata var. radiata]
MSMKNTVGLRLMMFVLCMVSEVVNGEEEIRCIPEEREALLQFKTAIVDEYGMLSSWNTPHCCQWEGIRCSNLTSHILSLDLHGDFLVQYDQRYLSGEIHKSLIELSQLQYLNLSSNSFPDTHIPEFLASLKNLKYLDLSHCYFGGRIPSQFGSLSHLKYLNLAWNSLKGSIPRQLENLSELQHLDLSCNRFDGNILPQLGNLSRLQYLDLRDNLLEGNIAPQFGNLSQLHELYLGGYHPQFYLSNNLKISDGGQWLSNLISLTHLSLESVSNLSISHSWLQAIAKLPKLRELSLVDCSLSDHLILSSKHSKFNFSTSLSVLDLSQNTFTSPMVFQWVSNITSNLVDLDLSLNALEGSTSSDFGIVMNSLRHLDLSFNNLKARDLKSFINICSLHSLSLSSNNLTEDLPSILGNLSSGCVRHSLQELGLLWNHITGTLSDISVFSSLKSLFLERNQLSGRIPQGVKLPSTLERLLISSNFIEGGLPKSFGNACSLLSLDISNNGLSDDLPMIISHLSGCAKYSLQELYLHRNQINGTLPDFSTFISLKILVLSENKLNGEIHKDIQFPPKLEELYMYSNSLKGALTDYHFANMSKLENLDLSDNSLGLAFTQNWVPPFQLLSIDLRSCQLGPTFPMWLQAQNKFFHIDISNATISDIIPEWFWAKLPLQKVMTINISSNSLRGKIPTSMGSLLDLQVLLLRSNNLVEGIPFSLRNCTKLVMLDLSENKLSGSIPDWIGTKQQLQILSLSKNQFFGSLPFTVCCLRKIQLLDLSVNNLSGKIPKCINNLTSMAQTTSSIYLYYVLKIGLYNSERQYYLNAWLTWKGSKQMFMTKGLSLLKNIDLSSNHFSEEIPIEIEKLSGLISLNLSRNNLIGNIPSNIGNLTLLDSLDLSRNRLVGSIPRSLAQIYGLGVLDLSHNHLSGEIPKGTQLQSFNKSSYENNFNLCGPPLEKCIEDGSAQEPNVEVDEDEYSLLNNDFFISMAFGFVFNIPNLRVGTLDSLLSLSNDLIKSNNFVEGVTHKIRHQIEELQRVSGVDSGGLTIDGVPVDS